MKQQNLCNFGFILLEAIVGISLFIVIVSLLLHGMGHITRQCVALHERHEALCIVLYAMEQAKKGKGHMPPFDNTIEIKIQDRGNATMPYTHASMTQYSIVAKKGSQSATVYYMGLANEI